MRSLVIVPPTESDMTEVCRRFDPFETGLVWQPRDPSAARWVAKRGSRVLGYTELLEDRDNDSPWAGWWLSMVWVRPLFRGLGIGERLALHRIAEAQRLGVPELLLLVFEGNEPSIRLHEKLGFEVVTIPVLEPILSLESQAVGRRHIVMRKRLQPSDGTSPSSSGAPPGPYLPA